MADQAFSRYGAYELKKRYQPNLIIGQAAVISFVAALISASSLFFPEVRSADSSPQQERFFDWPGPRQTDFSRIIPIPTIKPRPGKRYLAPQKPASGRMIAIDDSLEYEENAWISLQPASGPLGDNGGYGKADKTLGLWASGQDNDYLPPPDSFVIVQELPIIVHQELAEYPGIALEAGLDAEVCIQAFVDYDGQVVKALATQCSNPGIGFEEAAVKAAYRCTYRPAIQDGHPIGVWIAYRVKFIPR